MRCKELACLGYMPKRLLIQFKKYENVYEEFNKFCGTE